MTTPEIPVNPGTDPADPTPPAPEPTPEEAAAQQAAAEAAAQEAALNDQIRALATEIANQAILAFDPATIRKGTVTALATTSTPPTVTVTISGADTVEIPGVRYYEHYPPAVGDVVHLLKQGTDLVAIGKIAEQYSETEFVNLALNSGYSHNGNNNGNAQVRRVWDHGRWRVDLTGGVNVSGSAGDVIAVLDVKYRPPSGQLRTLLCPRDAPGGSNVVKVDVDSSGNMTVIGGTTAPASATPNDSTHSHGQHEHGIDDSTHAHPSHSHGIPNNDHFHGGDTGEHNANPSEHNHSGAVSTVSHSHTPHSHSISTTSHTHGGTDGSNAGDSTHSHSGTTQMTTPADSTHNHGSHHHDVTEPVWISFNSGTSYWI